VLVDRFYAERLYTSEELRQLLTRAGFCLANVHSDLITGSARNQDLGMMARRIVLTSCKNNAATRPRRYWPEVQARLNRLLGGWSAYFFHVALASVYWAVDDHVYDRVRNFLRKRHKAPGRGTTRFSRENVYEELGVLHLSRG
jgi:hypothetical protein